MCFHGADFLLNGLPNSPRLCLASHSLPNSGRVDRTIVSAIVGDIVPTEVRVRTLLGWLLGGVRAISAYDGDALGDGCMLTCALGVQFVG